MSQLDSLESQVRGVFAPAGLLSQTIESFVTREGQTEMAAAVARTIEVGGVLAVEAGTGIGKTYAYLVPALLSGNRVLVSTATKALQDQLFERDLPILARTLGLSLRMTLLKGRSSYLCLHRLGQARQNLPDSGTRVLSALAEVERWAQATHSGDLAELGMLDERSPVIPMITSTRDNCLGSQCPQFRDCHVNQARRQALAADLVVVNHHLFFADLAVRESGVAELLPSVQTVIFDEAHQLNETGVQFLGCHLSTAQLREFGRDLLLQAMLQARGLADWPTLAFDIDDAARDLRLMVGTSEMGTRLAWTQEAPEQVNAASWKSALAKVHRTCQRALIALERVSDMAPDLSHLCKRVSRLIEQLDYFASSPDGESVRWLDVGAQLNMVQAPVNISETMQAQLGRVGTGGRPQRTWIFTSATLGDDARLRWFTEACGLQEAEVLKFSSPFDYGSQATLYVPADMVRPGDPMHSAQVADFVARTAPWIGGRTLVLTTTLRALRVIGDALRLRFADTADLEILMQGQLSKRELMQRLRQGNSGGRAGCVLVASASFWEGVDVPGDALQMVVIDKLPFPPPNDPLVQARAKAVAAAGGNVFMNYFIPEAAVALKQGAGRLIRRESDRGMLVVCDTRLVQKAYGRRLLRAMPPMRVIATQDELLHALHALTIPSTMDQDCP